MNDSTISEILSAFKIFDGQYKREEIDKAVELKEEITPYLINILDELLADPEKYMENNDFYDHIYATMLLGHFKEPKAHKVIADIFSLPNRIVDPLFGDVIMENLPTILHNTSEGSLDQIKEMMQ